MLKGVGPKKRPAFFTAMTICLHVMIFPKNFPNNLSQRRDINTAGRNSFKYGRCFCTLSQLHRLENVWVIIYMGRAFSKAFYKSKEWKQVREYVMMRDNYLCRHCGAPATEVHHIKHLEPDNIMDPSITLNPDNLVSLCRDCHFEEHRGEHGLGRQREEEYGFQFDENGMLIKK